MIVRVLPVSSFEKGSSPGEWRAKVFATPLARGINGVEVSVPAYRGPVEIAMNFPCEGEFCQGELNFQFSHQGPFLQAWRLNEEDEWYIEPDVCNRFLFPDMKNENLLILLKKMVDEEF